MEETKINITADDNSTEVTSASKDAVSNKEEKSEKKSLDLMQKKDNGQLSVQKPHKRLLQGIVVSNKGDKTIIVKSERQVAHPLYKKYYKQSKKLMTHDPNNDCNEGDIVRIRECRPLSARKRWELIEIIQRAK